MKASKSTICAQNKESACVLDGLGLMVVGERTITTNTLLQIPNLRQSGILAAGAQQVAEGVEGDAAVAAFVEEGEGFFEVGALRLVFAHRVSIACAVEGCSGFGESVDVCAMRAESYERIQPK